MEKSTCRVVWLSDIHYRAKYNECTLSGDLELKRTEIFKSFLEIIKSEEKNTPIDYFFLTGDIAFSGTTEDYVAFWNWFIIPLFKYYDKLINRSAKSRISFPKFLTIPGNHDLDRKNIDQFEGFINQYSSKQTTLNQQYKAFKLNTKQFEKLFSNYSTVFSEDTLHKNAISKAAWKAFFELNTPSKYSKKYVSDRLYGFWVDEEKKIIIVLLNTAWFSIGNEFNSILRKKKLPNINAAEISSLNQDQILNFVNNKIETGVKELLEMKDHIGEYGNQITGRDVFPKSWLKELTKTKPGYLIITCMHHPQNWLSWGEVYDYKDQGANSTDFTLYQILEQTDILLTGHEHVPIIKMPENIDGPNGNRWHLKAGMFMEDQIDVLQGEDYFEHSRFSILDIDCEGYTFCESKYLYNKYTKKWNPYAPIKDITKTSYPLKKKTGSMTKAYKKEISKRIKDFDVEQFLKNRYYNKTPQVEKIIQEKNYCIYKTKDINGSDEVRYCIIPFTSKFKKTDFLPISFPYKHFVDDILTKEPVYDQVIKIHFIWPDVLVNDNIFNGYISPGENQTFETVFGDITRYSTLIFNKFRDVYFSRFERFYEENSRKNTHPKTQSIDFKLVKNVRFINEVIPFWIFKRYCSIK